MCTEPTPVGTAAGCGATGVGSATGRSFRHLSAGVLTT